MRFTGVAAASHASMTGAWLTDNRDLDRPRATTPISCAGPASACASCRRCCATGSVVGVGAARRSPTTLGLPDGVQVVTGTPDLHSGAVGAGTRARLRDPPRDQHDVVDQLPGAVQEDRHLPPDRDASPASTPDRYLVANNHETGGACLQWLRDQVIAPDDGLDRRRPPRRFDAADRRWPRRSRPARAT